MSCTSSQPVSRHDPLPSSSVCSHAWIPGSTVAKKIAATVQALGLTRFDMKFSNGTLPHDLMLKASSCTARRSSRSCRNCSTRRATRPGRSRFRDSKLGPRGPRGPRGPEVLAVRGVYGDAGELLASEFPFGLEPVIDRAAPVLAIQILGVRQRRDFFVTDRKRQRVGSNGLTQERRLPAGSGSPWRVSPVQSPHRPVLSEMTNAFACIPRRRSRLGARKVSPALQRADFSVERS